ncbi:MAG TPA: hypothetical protein VMD97_03110 [Candidatus Aquilonibacter sp.]|nr:hypothetical protein [Candidatus Aquilonibacter sp.]
MSYFAVPIGSDSGGAAQGTPAKKPKPALGNIGTGWTYLYAAQGADERESINGWYLRPAFDVGKGYSVYFDSTNYYGTNRKGSLNGHGFTFGVSHNVFAMRHLKPSIAAECGDVRTSNAGSIVNQFVFGAAFGVAIPINKHVSLALTPAEYVFLYPMSEPRNDYNAKVGLSFPFGHR